MKIQVTKSADYRVKPAVTMAFKVGRYDVPKKIGEALIQMGAASAVTKPVTEEN